jgi:hypothetical protein
LPIAQILHYEVPHTFSPAQIVSQPAPGAQEPAGNFPPSILHPFRYPAHNSVR